jgi:hypothetical protein
LARAFEEISRISKWQQRDNQYWSRKRTFELDAAVVRNIAKAAKKPLTVAQRIALRERHDVIAQTVEKVNIILRRRAKRVAELNGELAEIDRLRGKIAADENAYAAKCVVRAFGPEERPPQYTHSCGIEYTAKVFDLGKFLDDDVKRADTVALLKSFDAMGIHPQLFLFRCNKTAAHYVRPLLSDFGRAFRDVGAAARRPATKTYWTGLHRLQIKTSIAARSDVKYLIVAEGYNPGTNAPINVRIVGYASRTLEGVGEMEEYGWPAGWDEHTSSNMTRGVTSAQQYMSSDGYVCVELAAPSLSQVGLSLSIFVVTPGYGGATPAGCSVYHIQERL